MGDIDWFGQIFGAVPEGDVSWNKRVALAMIRNGLAVVTVTPNDKVARCLYHLDARGKKAADLAAQEAGTAKRDGTHRCGVYCSMTDEKALGRVGVKKLLEGVDGGPRANLAVSLAHSTRRVMIVDVDTDAERKAFLADWRERGGDVDENTPLTVTSPGVFRDDEWRHKDGGHIWFNVPDGVDLPAKGEAKWCGCHGFDRPGGKCERAWSLFWTGSERYVLVPPSVRPEGAYRVTGEVLDAPEWLVSIARESAERTPRGSGELNNDGAETINAWSQSHEWAELLTAAGWDEQGNDSCGPCLVWHRPGHANPKTATAHEVGCSQRTTDGGHGTLHLWSDAWRPWGKADLTKLDFVAAVWHHNEDIRVSRRAAMDALGIERKRKADDELFVLGESRSAKSATEPEPTDDGQARELAEFWDARPVLRNIHDFAWSEFAAPWATLGAVLAYVVALTPPRVKVNEASLNLFVGLVGPPGAGKDAAIKAAKKWIGDLASNGNLTERPVGSGQGIESAFVKRVRAKDKETGKDTDKFETVQVRENLMGKVSEIGTLIAHAKQQASTLVDTLLMIWMGQQLGSMYKEASKDLSVAEHTYRMCMLVGIQPGRARYLIDNKDAGLPQRFIWMPVEDPNFPDKAWEHRPEKWEWKPPVALRDFTDPFTVGEEVHEEPELEMGLCPRIRDEMNAERAARLRGTHEGDELSTHDTLGRLKIAAGLTLLDGRTDITEEDWRLSGIVHLMSTRTRSRVLRQLETEDHNRREAEKAQRAEIEVAVEKAKTSNTLDQAKARLLRALSRVEGHEMSRSDLRRKLRDNHRGMFEEAAEGLVESGDLVHLKTDKGERYRLAKK